MKIAAAGGSTITSSINTDKLTQYISDLKVTYPIIIASLGIAFVVAFIYMLLMRYFSGFFTWLVILAYFALVIALGYLFYNKSTKYKE